MFDVKKRHIRGAKAIEIRHFSGSSSSRQIEEVIVLRQLIHDGSEKKCESGVAEIDVNKWS